MKCPYCEKEMIPGAIYGDRYRMKWMPKDKKLILGIWAHDSIPLGETGFLSRPQIKASYCESCKKMIIDVKEEY